MGSMIAGGPAFPDLWFHVDMDAFFAAVEQRDTPEYRGKPLIVGALPGHRGVVSTCSYEARKFGVRSAMPISEAYRLCPQGIFIHPHFEKYQEASHKVMSILGSFTPRVIQVSVDEAFLDMKGTQGLWGSPREAAEKIKGRVFADTGLTISIGGASNKYCAKIASDFQKPDGLTIVEPGKESEFIRNLPLPKLWGLGKKSRERLDTWGIDSIAKILDMSEQRIQGILGKSGGAFLFQAVRGIDPGIYEGESKSHSLSHETTFEHDETDPQNIDDVLFALSTQIQLRLKNEGLHSRVLCLKLRYSDFSTFTMQIKNDRPLDSIEETFAVARQLIAKRWDGKTPIRLVGLGFSDLGHDTGQIDLFEPESRRQAQVENTILKLKEKFPQIPINKARLIPKPESPLNDDTKKG